MRYQKRHNLNSIDGKSVQVRQIGHYAQPFPEIIEHPMVMHNKMNLQMPIDQSSNFLWYSTVLLVHPTAIFQPKEINWNFAILDEMSSKQH